MTAQLTAREIEIVKSTQPVLATHGIAITTRMYERLFTEHPEVAEMFTTPGQQERLADAVLAYCENIDNVEALLPVVKNIAKKHVKAGVAAEQYDVVGGHLLGAMVDVLGELDATIIEAWASAYNVLAEVFISLEAELIAETGGTL